MNKKKRRSKTVTKKAKVQKGSRKRKGKSVDEELKEEEVEVNDICDDD